VQEKLFPGIQLEKVIIERVKQMSKVVAHSVKSFLFRTGSWIYSQISNLERYQPLVITTQKRNLDIFPFDNIYSLSDLNAPNRFFQKQYSKLTGLSYPFFLNLLKKNQASILHSHFGNRGYFDLALKRKLDLPQVTTFYGHDASSLPQEERWKKRFKTLFQYGDLMLAEGHYMKKTLLELGCPDGKVKVQHLGVDLEKIPFIPRTLNNHHTVKILIAGTFREKKGITYALEAFAKLASHYKNLEVTLVGDAGRSQREVDYKKEIITLIGNRNIAHRVNYLGFLPYPAFIEEAKNNHIFLSPSIHPSDGETEGGAPVALIEMSAFGMPIVSTFHCDIPEVVIDGESGFLVPEKNTDELAERLEHLINHPELWETMGRAGRKHMEAEFNILTQAKRLETIYDSLL
jgi:colanic acid/amylovoran biosynthesis glycosyltransferase